MKAFLKKILGSQHAREVKKLQPIVDRINEVFEGRRLPVTSNKSSVGHLIAAAGAVELITCVLSMRDSVIPPTINYQTPDPACDVDVVGNEARQNQTIHHVLSNSFGFGGQNVSLVISRPG